MFKLLIFDWDGTLMDSQARIVSSFQTAIAELGLPSRSPAQIRYIIGLGLEEAIRRLLPETSPEEQYALAECYRTHFVNTALPTPLFPGVATTLQHLEQAGYWLAVATGKSRRGLNQALLESGLKGLFHVTRCCEETSSKPHPQMLYEIMGELGMSAQESVMIGDTEYDLQMAHHAHMAAVAVSYGVHDKERLLAHRPLRCLDDFPQLLSLLHLEGSSSNKVSRDL